MASFFTPTFLNDFLGLMLRFDFTAAQSRVNSEIKYRHSHSLAKEVDNSLSSLLLLLSDFAAVAREQYCQSRASATTRLRTVGLRKWHFVSEPLVALGQVSDSSRIDLEREDIARSMLNTLSSAKDIDLLSLTFSSSGSSGGLSLRSSVNASQSVSLALASSVLSEEFRSQAATFDELGKNMGDKYRFLPEDLRTDFSDAKTTPQFTSQPFPGMRRANSPAPRTTMETKSESDKEKHTLSSLLLDIAFLLNMRSQIMRVYDCLSSNGFHNLNVNDMRTTLKELAALSASIVRMLEASLQSDVLTLMTEHDKHECSMLNHILCAMHSLLEWNCVPTLLSLYAARQIQMDWKKLYAELIGERIDAVSWSDNRTFTFLSLLEQHLAVKTSFIFHKTSPKLQDSPASNGLPFTFLPGSNIQRPCSFLPGCPSPSRHGPDTGLVIYVEEELNKMVGLTGCVISSAILLNSTKELPFNSAGFTCYAQEEAREIPSGLESWFPVLDAPRNSFTRFYVIDFSMIFYQVRADLELCRPCATRLVSVTNVTLDVVMQKVSPIEELYLVVLIAPVSSIPAHIKAKNVESYRKTIISSIQQFTDSLCNILSLKHVFALLKGPAPK